MFHVNLVDKRKTGPGFDKSETVEKKLKQSSTDGEVGETESNEVALAVFFC